MGECSFYFSSFVKYANPPMPENKPEAAVLDGSVHHSLPFQIHGTHYSRKSFCRHRENTDQVPKACWLSTGEDEGREKIGGKKCKQWLNLTTLLGLKSPFNSTPTTLSLTKERNQK